MELMARGRIGNIETFVLQHGRHFPQIGELPPFVNMGRLKMCFQNATHAALSNPSLTYCEGYAFSIFPVLHAWCVDEHGRVIEVTWPKEFNGADYFGIPFNTRFLMRQLSRTETYGLLDSPADKFALVRGYVAPELWLNTKHATQTPETV
jgi:hypothetical protein